MKKPLVVIILVLVVLMLGSLVIKRKKKLSAVEAYGMRPLVVHVASVTQEPLQKYHSYLGVVEPYQVANISSRISAKVDSVPYDEGYLVHKGELILHLDDEDIQAKIESLRANLHSLQTTSAFWVQEYKRDAQLAKEGVIPIVEAEATHTKMSDATAKLRAAQRTLESALTTLAYTQLKSPFDGQITVRNVDPGDLAVPGKILMVVEDLSSLKITFDATQDDMSFLKKGLPVRIKVGNKNITCAISRIYPNLTASRMLKVEVQTTSNMLVTGSFIPLKVITQEHKNATVVPRESIMRKGDTTFVFKVVNNTLVLTPVDIIMQGDGGLVEVTGLSVGEQVVTSTFLGWAHLADGLKVGVAK